MRTTIPVSYQSPGSELASIVPRSVRPCSMRSDRAPCTWLPVAGATSTHRDERPIVPA